MKINASDLSDSQYRAMEAFRAAKANEEYWEGVRKYEIERHGYSPNTEVTDHWKEMVRKRRDKARALIPSFDARVEGDSS